MKYINLKNDFQADRVKNPSLPPDQEITLSWIETAVSNGYRNGLSSDQRRMFMALMSKTEETAKQKLDHLVLNPVEYLFVMTGFKQTSVSPQEAKWISIAENAVLTATDSVPEQSTASVEEASKEEVKESE